MSRVSKTKLKTHGQLVDVDVLAIQDRLERSLGRKSSILKPATYSVPSNEEVAQYLVSFKQQETSSAHVLKEKIHQTYHNQLSHALTSGKKVNKTDADNLASQFGVSLFYPTKTLLTSTVVP